MGRQNLRRARGWSAPEIGEITDEMRARIVEVVKSHPQEPGESYANWSLSRLRAYLLKTRVVRPISKERLREILVRPQGKPTT